MDANPSLAGVSVERLRRAWRLVSEVRAAHGIESISLCLGRSAGAACRWSFGGEGAAGREPQESPGEEVLYLVASLTKPITATAIMLLVEQGQLLLDDRVSSILPAFGANGKEAVTIRHLLSHTSGLPDMLPDDAALRAAHAPLERFEEAIHGLKLDFAPGSRVRYQSMGFAVLGEVVRNLTGSSLVAFLGQELLNPLGMTQTALGIRLGARGRLAAIRRATEEPDADAFLDTDYWAEGIHRRIRARRAPVQLTEAQRVTDWNWNTAYWLGFGAPWGGLVTTVADYARFCRMMLGGGTLDGARILSPSTVRLMTSNQLQTFPNLPAEERRQRPWGLSWRLNWKGSSAHFGDLLSPSCFGHWGSTGTLCWVDPERDAYLVLFTTLPGGDESRHLALISNIMASCLE